MSLYLVLFSALGLGAGMLFWNAHEEYNQLKAAEARKRQELAALQAKLAAQRKTLERLRNDPEFVEKVIRRNLGYARPGEVIFRYDN